MNRNLDAEVVELIYGWKLAKVGPDYNGENECEILSPDGKIPKEIQMPAVGKIHKGFLAPQFSRDLEIAIGLAKRVKLPLMLSDMPDRPEQLTRMCLDHFKKYLPKE